MTTMTFRTNNYTEMLLNAGFTKRQADTQIQILQEVIESETQNLATGEGILKAKLDIIKWVVSVGIAQIGLTVGLIAIFLK